MPIMTVMRAIFSCLFLFCAISLFASPLESGYPLAPRATASPEERNQAFINARIRVVEASKKYLGTPYRYGGMSVAGVDCSGFLVLSFRDALGVSLPRSASALFSWTIRIPIDRAQPGDFVFFRTDPRSSNITHVGLYLGNRRFIHAASAGAHTGVIFSSLDEQYYINTYAGAGRAFPESPPFSLEDGSENNSTTGSTANSSANSSANAGGRRPDISTTQNGRLLLGIAIAPTFNGFIPDGDFVRGVASQLLLSVETYSFGRKMVFGLEVRPEYDGALGVFRLPITFSWGPNDQIRIFAGPVLSFGDATLSTQDGQRVYSGGTTWLGSIGITAAPFVYRSDAGDFSFYLEAAWQSYLSDNRNFDLARDFSAGFRFSTGVRWMVQVK